MKKNKQINKINNINKKRGSALAETVLLIAISLVLIVIIFYPQITGLFKSLVESMSTWFTNAITTIGVIN